MLECGDIVFFRFDTDVAGKKKGGGREKHTERMKSICNNVHE